MSTTELAVIPPLPEIVPAQFFKPGTLDPILERKVIDKEAMSAYIAAKNKRKSELA